MWREADNTIDVVLKYPCKVYSAVFTVSKLFLNLYIAYILWHLYE